MCIPRATILLLVSRYSWMLITKGLLLSCNAEHRRRYGWVCSWLQLLCYIYLFMFSMQELLSCMHMFFTSHISPQIAPSWILSAHSFPTKKNKVARRHPPTLSNLASVCCMEVCKFAPNFRIAFADWRSTRWSSKLERPWIAYVIWRSGRTWKARKQRYWKFQSFPCSQANTWHRWVLASFCVRLMSRLRRAFALKFGLKEEQTTGIGISSKLNHREAWVYTVSRSYISLMKSKWKNRRGGGCLKYVGICSCDLVEFALSIRVANDVRLVL